AEEYDAEKAAGNVASGRPKSLDGGETFQPTAKDIGLRHDEIHEARKLRDAEQAEPGLIRRSLDAMIERGEEPTRAALKREIVDRPQPQKVMNSDALWLWGRGKDFERVGILAHEAGFLVNQMTAPM
ncbi:hypothetical protein, partial [Escherichia coli]|uniref:hypothetical protein n=1 Tax=Escherichia coli TaxID=562 RepID=UPI003D2F1B19